MTKSPKILSVNVSDTSGGAARAAYRIHKAVNLYGGNSTMFVKNRSLKEPDILAVSDYDRPNGLTTAYRFVENKIKNKIQHHRWAAYPEREDAFMSDLRSSSIHGAFQKIDFDILHLHWVNLRFLDLNELTRVRKPIVWTLHDSWPFTGVCHYFYDCKHYHETCGTCPHLHSGRENDLSHAVWQSKQKIYEKLDLHIVSPSNWLADAARHSGLFKRFPVSVIPNPIDTAFFSPGNREEACAALGLDPTKKYLLFSAMNALKDKNKGFSQLVVALGLLEKRYDISGLCLLIVGSSEMKTISDIKIHIQNLGIIKDDKAMIQVLRAATITITPSLSENLSNGIMESMACGTPVVAFNIGGNADMIDHLQNGYLADELNTDDLARGIEWCLVHTNQINPEIKVNQVFRQSLVAERYMNFYRELYSR